MSKVIGVILLVAALVDVSFACNGYKLKINKMENCAGPDAVISFDDDFTIKLNKKCELVPSGCVINKPFSKAMGTFKVTKDGMVVKEGKTDMCTMADQIPSEGKEMIKLFGAPSQCPVPEEKICANDHKVDLSKYKNMLSMAKGTITIDSQIEHDTGKSCFHVEMEITKT